MKKTLFTFLGLLSFYSFGQLSGTKTIPVDYPSIAAFVTDVNAQGVQAGGGGVTLVVPAGYTETAPVGGYSITATGTVTDNITISGAGSPKPIITANAGLTIGSVNDAIFKIIGGDYINIANLDLRENPLNIISTPTGSNNMTEFGVALFYASTTDGAQHNSIIGNTITLDQTYRNAIGIYSTVRTNAILTALVADITAATGANSNNKVYGNVISNVNYGIVFLGSQNAAFQDTGNDIGGTTAATGNTITNWSLANAVSSYPDIPGQNVGITLNHQLNTNISYNTIVSAPQTTTFSLWGISQNFSVTPPTLPSISTINNNTITLHRAGLSGNFLSGISNQGISTLIPGSSLTMNNNAFINSSITPSGVTSMQAFGNASAYENITINNNTVYGNTMNASGFLAGFTGIINSGAFTGTLNIQNNSLGTLSSPAITVTAPSGATSISGIVNSAASATGTLNITGNDIRGIIHNTTTASAHTYISNSGAVLNLNVSNNTFTDITANTSANVTFINQTHTMPAGGTQIFNNNSIVTGYNKSAAGGTVNFINSGGASQNGTSATYTNNNFSNVTLTGATTLNAFNINAGNGSGTPTKIITGNTVSNVTAGTNAITCATINHFNASNTISNNTFTNVSGQGAITGFNIGATYSNGIAVNVTNNTIHTLSSTGTGGAVTGIASSNTSTGMNIANNDIHGLSSTGASLVTAATISNGLSTTFAANRIYGLSSSNAAGTVYGVNVTGGTLVNAYNNIIGGLTAPNGDAADVIRGISVNSAATGSTGVYFNSIYLNATSGGANFGTSGIYHQANATATTGALDLRNNIVINESTPNGTGITTAFRRSTTDLNNYDANSNRNNFYAGTPGANHLLMYDGTNSYQLIVPYITAVSPRDANSFPSEAAFTSSGYGTPGNFFISLTGSSTDFLRPVAGITTQNENTASTVSSPTITTDFAGASRSGTPDIGAYEFIGAHVPPVIVLNSVSPPTVTQCNGAARLVSANITTADGYLVGAVLNYSFNGVPQPAITMTNTSGSTWEATIPVATPVNATVTWSITATNSIPMNGTYNGTSYADAPLPVVGAGSDQIVCSGTSVTLNGSGATSYTWDNGVTNGTPFTATATTTYTVTGTDGNGCQNTDQVVVNVNALPTVGAGSDQTVCAGTSVTLNGSGATSYTWDNGVTNGVAFTPTSTLTYTVTGTDANGCQNTDQVVVNVNALPSVSAGSDQAVCTGGSVTLNGSGATSYAWDNGVTDGVAFTPASTLTYTVTGTDGNGCQNTDQVDVTVNSLPNVSAGTDQTVCAGTSVTLNGAGATSYAWDNGVTDGVAFTPASTMTYTVTGTDANGCQNTDQVTVTVNTLPTVDAGSDQTVCEGTSVTLNGSGAVSYTWNNGVTNGVPFTATATTTYTVTGTDANGCQNTDQMVVNVNTLPAVSAGADQSSCSGSPVTLSGSGATIYTWNNGVINGIPFVPLSTMTYTVTGTDANGCQNSDQVVVTVGNPTSGTDIQTACGSYTWIDGLTYTASTNTPTFTLTNAAGCDSVITLNLTINAIPVANVFANGDQTITSSSGASYQWINCSNNAVIAGATAQTFAPTVSGSYAVVLTNASGCSDTSSCVTITIAGDSTIVIPEAVTPNGDGYNDVLEIPGIASFADNHLIIYNRWGNIVYETDGYNNDWNGTCNANQTVGGTDLPSGTYYYLLDVKDETMGEDGVYKGFIYLQR